MSLHYLFGELSLFIAIRKTQFYTENAWVSKIWQLGFRNICTPRIMFHCIIVPLCADHLFDLKTAKNEIKMDNCSNYCSLNIDAYLLHCVQTKALNYSYLKLVLGLLSFSYSFFCFTLLLHCFNTHLTYTYL